MLNSVLVMLGGGIVSQLISIVTALVVARLYDVSVIGEYSVFLMCATVISSVVFLRLELSLGHADVTDISYTRAVIKKVKYFTFPLVVLAVGVVAYLYDFYYSVINIPILLLAIYVVSAYRLMYYSICFSSGFALLAGLKVKLALSLLLLSSVLGYLLPVTYSLISSFIFSHGLLAVLNRNKAAQKISIREAKLFLARKKDFLTKMTLGSVLSLVSSYMIMFVVSYKFGLEMVGYYAVAEKMFRTPLGVIQASLADVLRVKLDGLRNKAVAWKFVILSVMLSLSFVVFLYFFAAVLIDFLLGEKWTYVTNIVIYLLPLSFFQMILQPLLPIFQQGERSSFEIIFNVLFIFSVFVCGVTFGGNKEAFFSSLVFFLSPVYLGALIFTLNFINKR